MRNAAGGGRHRRIAEQHLQQDGRHEREWLHLAEPLGGPTCRRSYPLQGRRLRQAARRKAVDGVLDHRRFDVWQPAAGLVADDVVAGDQRHRHTVVASQRGVEARLTGWFAIESDVPQGVGASERVA